MARFNECFIGMGGAFEAPKTASTTWGDIICESQKVNFDIWMQAIVKVDVLIEAIWRTCRAAPLLAWCVCRAPAPAHSVHPRLHTLYDRACVHRAPTPVMHRALASVHVVTLSC